MLIKEVVTLSDKLREILDIGQFLHHTLTPVPNNMKEKKNNFNGGCIYDMTTCWCDLGMLNNSKQDLKPHAICLKHFVNENKEPPHITKLEVTEEIHCHKSN